MARRLETLDRRGFSTTHATSPPPPAATNAWQHRGWVGCDLFVQGTAKNTRYNLGLFLGNGAVGTCFVVAIHLFFFDGAEELAASGFLGR